MDLCINKKNIEEVVKALGRISLKGIVHPVLKLSKFEIKDNSLLITSTNLSLAVIVEIPLTENISNKVIYLESTILERILSGTLDQINVNLSFKENYLEVKTNKAKAKIPYQEGEDFPSIPEVIGDNISLPANNLRRALQITIPGASTTDIKPELASVFVNLQNNKLTCVTTDAFQLIEYKENITTDKDISFLLPAKEAGDIVKIVENIDGPLSAVITETLLKIQTKTTTIITKLTQGLFPDYTTIIPKNEKCNVRILKADLDNAIKFLMQLKNENNHVILSLKDNQLNLFVKNNTGGESEYSINVTSSGEEFSGTVLVGHLKNLLNIIPEENLSILYYEKNKPFVVRGVNKNDFMYLMMPITS